MSAGSSIQPRSEKAHQVKARSIGQLQIAEKQVEGPLIGGANPGRHAAGDADVVALASEQQREGPRRAGVILDQQNVDAAGRRAGPLKPRARERCHHGSSSTTEHIAPKKHPERGMIRRPCAPVQISSSCSTIAS